MPLAHASELGSASDLSELHNHETLTEITEESLLSISEEPLQVERRSTAPIIPLNHIIEEPQSKKSASSKTLGFFRKSKTMPSDI